MVAEAIGEVLQSECEVQVISSNELTANHFDNIDLVIMGSPTHKMNLPEAVRPVLDNLPKKILKGKQVAAFDTSYKMSKWLDYFTAGKKLSRKLHKLGGKRIVPPEIFHVMERKGPLYEGELKRAKNWAKLTLDRSIKQ